jgi:hypothetical protein
MWREVRAIKFRYSINLSSSSSSSSSDSKSEGGGGGFEAKVIARKEEGWEGKLEEAVMRWIETVCLEMTVEGSDS